jgi:hypothetical protein
VYIALGLLEVMVMFWEAFTNEYKSWKKENYLDVSYHMLWLACEWLKQDIQDRHSSNLTSLKTSEQDFGLIIYRTSVQKTITF